MECGCPSRRDLDIRKCGCHGRAVAGQAVGHSLVSACDRVHAVVAAVVWHCAQGAFVGMWFAGLAAVTSLAKVGVVVWQLAQSPLVG